MFNSTRLYLIIFLSFFASTVIAQNKYQYISVTIYFAFSDHISYSVDTSGLAQDLKQQLKNFNEQQKKFSRLTQLYNSLGNMGWEFMYKEPDLVVLKNQIEPSGRPLDFNPPRATYYYFKKRTN